MIKSVTVVNNLGKGVKVVLSEAEPEHGFLITKIDGLGPAKGNINMTELATNNGSLFNSSRITSRNIVLSLYFVKANSIEDVRQRSYEYFPIAQPVELLIETDNRLVKTTGYVETNEPDIFSNNESAQISILCPDPFLYSADENDNEVIEFESVTANFEFPFENNSLEDYLIEFGEITTVSEKTIYYSGDAEIGVTIKMVFSGVASGLSVYNATTRERMTIDTDKIKWREYDPVSGQYIDRTGVIAGDTIIIETSRGAKSIRLLRSGVYTNILNSLDRDSAWIHLVKGDNVFTYSVDEGSTNMSLTVEHKTVYEGI